MGTTMRNIFIIFLFISFTASAQWKETGRTQVWPAEIHLKDSLTGQSKGVVHGYVRAWASVYFVNGVQDKSRGVSWENIKEIMDANHKKIAWKEYDYYDVIEPGTEKHHMR